MNRRDLLAGLGTAAAGTSLVLGSSAFTQVSSARHVTIRVSSDSEALVELDPGTPEVVEENGEGELEISTDDFGSFNEHATVEIGDVEAPSDGPAFTVTNNFDEEIEVTLDTGQITDGNGGTFKLKPSTGNVSDDELTVTLNSGDDLDLAIEIKTDDAGSNFNGPLEVAAQTTN